MRVRASATDQLLTRRFSAVRITDWMPDVGPIPDDGLAWLNVAVKHWRVILLDQRGTGRSTPVRSTVLESKGSVQDQVEYLKLFRADSIIRVSSSPCASSVQQPRHAASTATLQHLEHHSLCGRRMQRRYAGRSYRTTIKHGRFSGRASVASAALSTCPSSQPVRPLAQAPTTPAPS